MGWFSGAQNLRVKSISPQVLILLLDIVRLLIVMVLVDRSQRKLAEKRLTDKSYKLNKTIL